MTKECAIPGTEWVGGDGKALVPSEPFGLLGILNLTPDSFFDGGKYQEKEAALAHAASLLSQGALVLDLGAESTRPGSDPVSAEEEWARLAPAFFAIRRAFPDTPVSIDTWHADTASRALENGARIINDISAFDYDPGLLDTLVQFRPAYILMHSQGRPKHMQERPVYRDVVREVAGFFEKKLNLLARAGFPENRVLLDPGIGFGKTLEHNLELLANLEVFLSFGRPLLGAVSMKSMFGNLLGLEPSGRASSTSVASALLWEKGVFWHRVHDVAGVRNALLLASALAKRNRRKYGLPPKSSCLAESGKPWTP